MGRVYTPAELAENRQKAEQSLQYLAKRFAKKTKPESLPLWCEKIEKKLNWDRSSKSIVGMMTTRMRTIETLNGVSTLEKMKILFIFSQVIGTKFKDILLKEGHTVVLDYRHRIKSFKSKDGSIVLSSDHKRKIRPYINREKDSATEVSATTPKKRVTKPKKSAKTPPPKQKPKPKPKKPRRAAENTTGGELGLGIRFEIGDDRQARVVFPPEVELKDGIRFVAGLFGENQQQNAGNEVLHEAPEDIIPMDRVGHVKEEEEMDQEDMYQPEYHNGGEQYDYEFDRPLGREIKREPIPEQPEKEHSAVKPLIFVHTNPLPSTSNALNRPMPYIPAKSLTEQIEVIATSLGLPDLVLFARMASESLETQHETIHIDEFNQCLGGLIFMLRRARTLHPTEPSISFEQLLDTLRQSLIRPLGDALVVDSLSIIDEFDELLGDSSVQFVSLTTVQKKMESMIRLTTGHDK